MLRADGTPITQFPIETSSVQVNYTPDFEPDDEIDAPSMFSPQPEPPVTAAAAEPPAAVATIEPPAAEPPATVTAKEPPAAVAAEPPAAADSSEQQDGFFLFYTDEEGIKEGKRD